MAMIREGTIIVLIPINPSVPFHRVITANITIKVVPIIFGIPKYSFIKEPQPARMIEALLNIYKVVIRAVPLLKTERKGLSLFPFVTRAIISA